MWQQTAYRLIRFRPWLFLAFVVWALSACSTLDFYAQSAAGQWQVLSRSRPITAVLDSPETAEPVKERLRLVLALRRFAVESLALPDNGSYRRYADLERPYVVWSVFAAPAFSLEPKSWCYPLAGCVSYRGYFSRARAQRLAAVLQGQGYDVFVGGVAAYSTLGWFDDPVLNTVLDWPETELAALVFHELAHERLYVPGDSAFNESFATAVAREGVRRWLLQQGDGQGLAAYRARLGHRRETLRMVAETRRRLGELYQSELPDAAKQAAKAALFEALKADYQRLAAEAAQPDGLAAWFQGELNNAHLAALATYEDLAPQFEALLQAAGGDLAVFYREAEALAALPAAERHRRLSLHVSPGSREQAYGREDKPESR